MSASIELEGHTTADGTLNLSVNVGLPNSDVAVRLVVTPVSAPSGEVAAGWPDGYFERVVGSMPNLERAPQGDYEQRLPLT